MEAVITDKEIIIDGVNVAGCEFYCDKYCTSSNDRNERLPFAEKCSEYSDCLYKQFQRKEQELETICKAFDIEYVRDEETGHIIGRCNKLLAKKQEYEELKRDNNILKEHSRYYKNESKRYKKEIGKLKTAKEQAKQKLERDNKTMLDFLEAYYVDGENEGTLIE